MVIRVIITSYVIVIFIVESTELNVTVRGQIVKVAQVSGMGDCYEMPQGRRHPFEVDIEKASRFEKRMVSNGHRSSLSRVAQTLLRILSQKAS